MIVVDSSVWIARYRGQSVWQADRLNQLVMRGTVVLGDVILLELLQGARNEDHAAQMSASLSAFPVEQMLSAHLALKAAANYRLLRRRGVTIRKTIDIIIGTFCIEHDITLLQLDRDFQPMAEHLGLRLM